MVVIDKHIQNNYSAIIADYIHKYFSTFIRLKICTNDLIAWIPVCTFICVLFFFSFPIISWIYEFICFQLFFFFIRSEKKSERWFVSNWKTSIGRENRLVACLVMLIASKIIHLKLKKKCLFALNFLCLFVSLINNLVCVSPFSVLKTRFSCMFNKCHVNIL